MTRETAGDGAQALSPASSCEGGEAPSPRPSPPVGERENAPDWSIVAQLPDGARTEFRMLHGYASRIANERGLLGRCKAIAGELRLPWQTVYRRIGDFNRTGDWQALIDKRHLSALWHRRDQETLPRDFIEHMREACGANQRASATALRKIIRQWQAWYNGDATARIPGYDTCPAPAPGIYPPRPAGWSEANLRRKLQSKFELVAVRQGRSAAADHRPLMSYTRRELWAGSHYLFDDLWHDNFVNLLDTQKTGRPLEFHALDLYSACKIGWGYFLRTQDDLTGKMTGLSESGMRFLLAAVLMKEGYHATRGTTLVVENGTAAVGEDLEQLLSDLTGGMIKAERAPMSGRPAFTGQYAGRGKGNFRFKAALESLGNLIHNELADLRAQTGLSKEMRPEETHGMLVKNDALARALLALPPERARRLAFPVLEFSDWKSIANEVYERINARTEHALEGWERNTLPVRVDAGVGPGFGVQVSGGELRVRRMSPMEVWTQGRRQLTALPAAKVALILYRDWLAVTRTIRKHQFTFQEGEITPDPLRYDAHLLKDGEKYDCILNPFMPEVLWVFNAGGRYVGTCPRLAAVDRADAEASQAEMLRLAKIEGELLAPVSKRGHKVRLQRIAQMRQNIGALQEPAEAKLPRLTNDRFSDLEDLPDEAQPVNPVNTGGIEDL